MKAEQVPGWLGLLRNVFCGAGKRKTGKQSPDANDMVKSPNHERRIDLIRRAGRLPHRPLNAELYLIEKHPLILARQVRRARSLRARSATP